jgi:hypothetical protein
MSDPKKRISVVTQDLTPNLPTLKESPTGPLSKRATLKVKKLSQVLGPEVVPEAVKDEFP